MILKIGVYDAQAVALEGSLSSAQEWEDANGQLEDFRWKRTIIDQMGCVLCQKTIQGNQPVSQFARRWCDSAGEHMVGRDAFVKFGLMFKNTSEILVEGSKAEVIQQLEQAYELLVKLMIRAGFKEFIEEGDGEQGTKLDVHVAVSALVQAGTAYKAQEKQLREIESSLSVKARATQNEYIETTARRQTEFNLQVGARKNILSPELYSELVRW